MTSSAPAIATAPDGLDFSVARLFADAWDTWVAGGWAMIPIFVTAAVMFGVGASVWLRLVAKGFGAVPEKVWRLWIAHPNPGKAASANCSTRPRTRRRPRSRWQRSPACARPSWRRSRAT